MSTTFGIKINNKIVEVANRDTLGNKIIITIYNDLLWLIPNNTPVIALNNSSEGIKTVEDIIRYVNDKFDDGFRPVGNRCISSHDICIKCGKPFSKHISNNRFCPK